MRGAFLLPIVCLVRLGFAAEGGADSPAVASSNEIQLSITAPPQSFYVIGEPIPIEWKFTNTTAEPLGMFWEGCCFTYGEIVAEDAKGERLERKLPPPPPNAPPGWTPDPKAAQAWHAFPMVTRIEPHASVTFQTVLDNWLMLSRSGKFKLMAKYTGAPESALKQRGQKLKLWNGKAESAAFELELLTPRDYLARLPVSDDVTVTLTAPSHAFSPGAEPFKLSLSVHCANDKPMALHSRLWMLDPEGTRVQSPGAMQTGEVERVGEGGTTLGTLAVPPEALIGKPLAQQYSAFVEVIDDANPSRRWVSKAVTFVYALDRESVVALIRDAANRPGVRGERSASMRILRAYLPEIGLILHEDDVAKQFNSESETKLYAELKLASALCKPGVPLSTNVYMEEQSGKWLLRPESIAAELKWADGVSSEEAARLLAQLDAAHEHLAGPITIEVRPTQTQAGTLRKLGAALSAAGLLNLVTVRLSHSMFIHLTRAPAPNLLFAVNSKQLVDFQVKVRNRNEPELVPQFGGDEIEKFRTSERHFRDPGAFRSSVLDVYAPAEVRVLLMMSDDETLNPSSLEILGGFGDVELSF